ncbi:sialidase family protein [Chryseolinea lacunae]|uniref:Exo-alpha-sialidase n=1 Tax=Chryseolinea lacunae TaxID=2801331 RepID=A0ABS1KPF9_9BACT|nr:sialidase family protein [Chryseolinea lacunae]MBL0741118.1 exo-alpha-sialidase [Chryseolinea lacunae]
MQQKTSLLLVVFFVGLLCCFSAIIPAQNNDALVKVASVQDAEAIRYVTSIRFTDQAEQPSGDPVTFNTLSKDFVFPEGQPFPQCHASSIVRAGDQFLVAWFGGTHEKHSDVGIWLSRGTPGHWSAPIEVAKLREDAHWNPVLFKKPNGEIILYFKVGKTIDAWETWFKVSSDNGATWSAAKELVRGDKGGRGPVRNKPILLSNGTWLAPSSNERKGVWNAFVDRSEDQGKTWKASAFIPLNRDSVPGEGVIQPTLWESAPGEVHMLLRSSAGVICRSDSHDAGKTWTAIYKTTLPNPNSGIDITRLDNGTLVLVYNRDGKNWGARHPISLTASKDNGKTWSPPFDIETGQGDDEFSYPSIISFGDTVALTYTWKRKSISCWVGTVK